ncbi:hypothetical protein SteCoe_11062 [Stentor coeruleus]|uniref:C2H2-type domain-containing protein n=1 Tax=Stentor coeruleus TaxID=5963 RepID=A0A1R2CDZ3_9CILI|nr:hypothetical protein SteCoe_11062 [Stentor coeruleus]
MEGPEVLNITLFCCAVAGCGKEYKSKFNLKKHMFISHLGKNNFRCKKCNKLFVSKQNLREHSFIHSNIKPFKCSYCGKRFRQTSQLCMHKREHKKKYAETLKYAMLIDKD